MPRPRRWSRCRVSGPLHSPFSPQYAGQPRAACPTTSALRLVRAENRLGPASGTHRFQFSDGLLAMALSRPQFTKCWLAWSDYRNGWHRRVACSISCDWRIKTSIGALSHSVAVGRGITLISSEGDRGINRLVLLRPPWSVLAHHLLSGKNIYQGKLGGAMWIVPIKPHDPSKQRGAR